MSEETQVNPVHVMVARYYEAVMLFERLRKILDPEDKEQVTALMERLFHSETQDSSKA